MLYLFEELRHGDLQVFWSKLFQIRAKFLCRTRNAYRAQRERYQVNFRGDNKP